MNLQKVSVAIASVAALLVGIVTMVLVGSARERKQGIAFFAGWLIPGLGHAIVGKLGKGLFLFGLLTVTYVFGLWLSGWHTVSFDDNPFYHVGMYGSGLTTALGFALGDPKAFPRDDIPKSWFDPGLLYVCVVGLLNVVLMINVVTMKLKPAPATEPAAGEAPPPAPAEAPAPATGEGAKG